MSSSHTETVPAKNLRVVQREDPFGSNRQAARAEESVEPGLKASWPLAKLA